ncbi:MAG TPA: glycosyltransferase family 2 protein [Cyclobacteriaceae bacterium]|nr:glycosyltransferase family 2 protein [Cyclobacteriaceae bacterium]
MDKQPLLSVVTVVHNGVRHIENTIKSVISQTYPHIEYIIIDGNSTDGTQDIINKYRNQISEFISEPDRGIYDAMNKGLRTSHGDYILFLNCGDSIYKPGTVSDILIKGDADIFYGETLLTNGEGNDLGTRSLLTTRQLPDMLNDRSFLKGMVVSHQAFIARRSITPLYDLRYKCSADIDWCITILKRSTVIKRFDDIMVRYLSEGYSTRFRGHCLAERFIIFVRKYGVIMAILSHILIFFRYLFFITRRVVLRASPNGVER